MSVCSYFDSVCSNVYKTIELLGLWLQGGDGGWLLGWVDLALLYFVPPAGGQLL